MELGGYKVPKGTLLFLSMGGMQQLKQIVDLSLSAALLAGHQLETCSCGKGLQDTQIARQRSTMLGDYKGSCCAACRATVEDMDLGGYKVPKGTLLFLSMGGMHVSLPGATQVLPGECKSF
jgi:hypothetical protein